MTAFGRFLLRTEVGQWSVDIQSVNRKGLDLVVQLPPSLLFLDPLIREWMGQIVERGHVTVRVGFEFEMVDQQVAHLHQLKQRWEKVATSLGYDKTVVDFQFLVEQIENHEIGIDEQLFVRDLQKVWSGAAAAWGEMKQREGRSIGADIRRRLELLKGEVIEIEKLQPTIRTKYLEKMNERLKQFSIDEERLLREAAIFAEKGDITEEIVRLNTHISQMEHYLSSPEKSVGRTLEFLSQEMGREIGTLMAKAADSAIAKRGVAIKAEIEKIREQVHNIE